MGILPAELSVERTVPGMELGPVRPELKQIVAEASEALAHLDAERLEEMALSCEALNRGLTGANLDEWRKLASESLAAEQEMAKLSRILEATRSNLEVLRRLRESRLGEFDYSPTNAGWSQTENCHGHN